MIDLTGCIAIPLLKKSAFTGSCQGMRYRLKKESVPAEGEEGEKDVIRATVWPEPFSFPATPDEKKEWADFPFSKEGIDEAVAWMNQKHEEKYRG